MSGIGRVEDTDSMLTNVDRPGGLVGPAKEDPDWPVVLCIIAGHILDGIDSEPTYVDWWYPGD